MILPGVNRHPHMELGQGMMREVQEGRARAQLSSPGEGRRGKAGSSRAVNSQGSSLTAAREGTTSGRSDFSKAGGDGITARLRTACRCFGDSDWLLTWRDVNSRHTEELTQSQNP